MSFTQTAQKKSLSQVEKSLKLLYCSESVQILLHCFEFAIRKNERESVSARYIYLNDAAHDLL